MTAIIMSIVHVIEPFTAMKIITVSIAFLSAGPPSYPIKESKFVAGKRKKQVSLVHYHLACIL